MLKKSLTLLRQAPSVNSVTFLSLIVPVISSEFDVIGHGAKNFLLCYDDDYA